MLAGKHDNLEQYGRHSSVDLLNVPLMPGDSCTNAALKAMHHLMDVPLYENYIERWHVLGRPLFSLFPIEKPKLPNLTLR